MKANKLCAAQRKGNMAGRKENIEEGEQKLRSVLETKERGVVCVCARCRGVTG